MNKKRIIVSVTGTSGIIMAPLLLRALFELPEGETSLLTTESARLAREMEAALPFAERVP
jgi:3-polyprenyl-4-hydroxybenzoate decarboxylase